MPAIGFFIQHFPPYLGGAERQARTLASQLAEKDIPLEVLTTRFSRELETLTIEKGFTVRRLPTASPRWLKLPFNILIGFLAGIMIARRVEVFHGHCLSPFCLGALLAAKCTRRPMAIKICSVGAEGDIARTQGFGPGHLLWRIFRHADLFFATTSEAFAELQAGGISADRITLIPNLLESDSIDIGIASRDDVRQRLGLDQRLTLLYVGRLHAGKGLSELTRAWQEIAQDYDMQLVIIGDGPEFDTLNAWRAQLSAPEKVFLAGYQSNPWPYYSAADLFIFPSYSESFGNVIVEAMASGLAVITTEVGVVRDWSRSAPLVRIEAHHPEELVQAMTRLISEPATRRDLGSAARDFISEQYSPEAVAAMYEHSYNQLLGGLDLTPPKQHQE